jgi:hypothetical protein
MGKHVAVGIEKSKRVCRVEPLIVFLRLKVLHKLVFGSQLHQDDRHKTMSAFDKNPIPKVAALILVSACLVPIMIGLDAHALAKLNLMTPEKYVAYRRSISQHAHPFLFHFLFVVIAGGFFLGAIDFLSYLFGLPFQKRRETNPSN